MSCARSVKPLPPVETATVVCPKEAYQWAEGPVDPVGITLEDTEIEDALNRARWGRDIARQNSSASCLRKRDAGHLPPGIDP